MRLSATRRSGLRTVLDAALLAVIAIGTLYATVATALAPRNPARGVAVVFAPWVGADTAFVRTVAAGARFVRFGSQDFVTMAIPENEDYSARGRSAGALFVVDPQVVEACQRFFGLGAVR